MNEQKLPMLPPSVELEIKAVLKQLARANRELATRYFSNIMKKVCHFSHNSFRT